MNKVIAPKMYRRPGPPVESNAKLKNTFYFLPLWFNYGVPRPRCRDVDSEKELGMKTEMMLYALHSLNIGW